MIIVLGNYSLSHPQTLPTTNKQTKIDGESILPQPGEQIGTGQAQGSRAGQDKLCGEMEQPFTRIFKTSP